MKSLLKTVAQRAANESLLALVQTVREAGLSAYNPNSRRRGTSHAEVRGLDGSQLLPLAASSWAGTPGRSLCGHASTSERARHPASASAPWGADTPTREDKWLD